MLALLTSTVGVGQNGYWQQAVEYEMEIDFDVTKHQFTGEQTLKYTNNSPDTLKRVFYHLYFNAFQPGSAMDIRSRSLPDPDARISDRIAYLNPDEIGYHRIQSLEQKGEKLQYNVEGTVMEVQLNKPLLPGKSTELHMRFESQVPVQIRRSGRTNVEGVDYTLTQWYPKMAEYDSDGWHTDAYVQREFHGVFGSFDVKINMDAAYTLAGTGVVQNPTDVGHGYSDQQADQEKLQWHFKASNVHDFAWAADPEFVHTTAQVPDGPLLRFFHRNDSSINENWKRLEPQAVKLFEIMNARFGKYPYSEFSVIQAGDGGMEYPMCTMISGEGSFGGLVSVTVHEAIHNWFYGVLASNELKYPWMDEGFTTYAQNIVLDSLRGNHSANPHAKNYRKYFNLLNFATEEPLSTHADHYETNSAYAMASYSKGCVFLHQLSYVIGQQAFNKGMLRYFDTWKFKHPTPKDFKRIMETVSDLELDWYFENWTGTTKQIDYGMTQVVSDQGKTKVLIERKGDMSMPVELGVILDNDQVEVYYIPLEGMRGEKQSDYRKDIEWVPCRDWTWTYSHYELTIERPLGEIKAMIIDPKEKTADVDRSNNIYPRADEGMIQRSTD